MGKKLLCLVNPHAGSVKIKSSLLKILDNFVKAGNDITVYTTQKKGDATDFCAAHAGEFEKVVCCGGDGTLSETINGILKNGASPAIGYIPCGTTNDFAFNYGLPADNVKAGELIASGEAKHLDVGLINGHAFAYVAAFGAFTDLSYNTPQQSKAAFGKLAYYAGTLKALPNLTSYHAVVECNGETFEDDILYGMISNSKHVGGFKMTTIMKNITDISLDDGLLEAMFVSKPKNVAEFQSIINSMLSSKPTPFIHSYQTSSVRITFSDPTPWTLDGEFGGDLKEVDFSVSDRDFRMFY